jgi:anti-sigma factor RsiW
MDELLALSPAGLLDAAEERELREHVHDCAACAARLQSFAAIAQGLGSMPSPVIPADLALRTQARMEAELTASADRRSGTLLAVAATLIGWVSWFGIWDLYRGLTAGIDGLLRPGWPGLWACGGISIAMAFLAAPMTAALVRARRRERSMG